MADTRRRNTTQQSAAKKDAKFPAHAGEGIVLVNGAFEIAALNTGAESILRYMDEGSDPIGGPARLSPGLLDLLKAQNDLDGAQLFVNASGREYSCRSFLLKPRSDDITQPVFALYLRQEMSMADTVLQVGAEYRLTDREQQALTGVVMGLSSKQLAERMQISPNTVKVFMRLIMIKMGATTRAGIVGKLIDHNSHLLADGSGRQRDRAASEHN
ncbi:MAG: helix-turn-helix transcriptional regulator [Bryobacteraceae bacterium]|jgi:DNA-binding CsgD family transcriptional regulator